MHSGIKTKTPSVSQGKLEAYVAAQIAGGVTYEGGYNADTNTPDLDTSPSGIMKGEMYTVTVAGTFFTAVLEVEDVLISEKDDPTLETDWTIINKNIPISEVLHNALSDLQGGIWHLTEEEKTKVGSLLNAHVDSPMIISGGEISEGTNAGTFKVAALTSLLRITDDVLGVLSYETLAEQDNQAITAADTTYFICLDYNGGTPQIVLDTTNPYTRTSSPDRTQIPIGKVMKDSSDNVHFISGGYNFQDAPEKFHTRIMTLHNHTLASGSAIAYSGTNNFTMEVGSVYGGVNSYDLNSYNSASVTFIPVYGDVPGTGFTEGAARNTIDFAHYDDGSGTLADVNNAKFACFWIYRHIDDGDVYVIYGSCNGSLAEAESAEEPDKPTHLTDFGILIGKVVTPKAGGSFALVQMITDTKFAGTSASDHGNLTGLEDDDHPQYIKDSEFTAADEVMVGTEAGTFTKVTLGASEILGKKATGNADNLTASEVRTILNIEDGATADQTDAEILAAFENENQGVSTTDTPEFVGLTISGVPITNDYVYGIRYNETTDVITKGVIVNGIFVESEYTDYPIQNAHSRVLKDCITGEEHYLNSSDSNYLQDGVTAATFDGTAGDVYSKSPKFYELWCRDETYMYVLVSFSAFSFNGYTAIVPPHFNGKDFYYYDCFEGVLYDDSASAVITGDGTSSADNANDSIRSLPGFKPWAYQTRPDFRVLYRNRGGNTHQQSWSSYQSLTALFVTKYGTWDSQTALPGYTDASTYSYDYVRNTGRTLGLGNTDGSILVALGTTDSDLAGIVAADKYIANSFLGIENIFGHLWKIIDGINIDNTIGLCKVYTSTDYLNFADNTAINYMDTGQAPASPCFWG